jgi:hypothetical protein
METLEVTAPESANIQQSISLLSYSLKQRFAVLRGVYQSDAITLKLTLLLDGKGENSYRKVTDKIEDILQADYKNQQYHDALYDAFDLDIQVTAEDIMSTVAAVRRDNGLPAYISSIKTNSLRDFNRLFVVSYVYQAVPIEETPKVKRQVIGYTPLFKLKPEDLD